MPNYDVNVKLRFEYPLAATIRSAKQSAESMQAKTLTDDSENNKLVLQFDKKLYGKYLGDRSRFEIEFETEESGSTLLKILAYPVNPIGQKLMFGARKGVISAILEALYAEMIKRLEP